MALAYLGLGGNLGERDRHLDAALAAIGDLGTLRRVSRRYRSAPVGFGAQPEFLNQVAELETDLAPGDLLRRLKEIEARLGRTPSFRDGPRVIDIDILLYDDVTLDEPGLRIPHPRLAERAFVLRPLAELTDHVLHTPVTELLERVTAQSAEPVTDA